MNMPPLNRFTTKAKDAVRKAHEVAIERGQNTVTPNHLLAALLISDDGIVVSVLEKLEIDYPLFLDNTLEKIDEYNSVRESDTSSPSYQMFLNPELILILEESEKLSKDMQDNFIATEHLFLSILLNPDEKISDLVEQFKINQKDIFETIFKIKESGEKEPKKKKFKYLTRFAKNLTKLAGENKLDPVIGREKEIERSIQILSRRKKNNPILIGEAGVGKTAVVEGIAQKIVEKNIPRNLIDKEIFSLDMGLLIAGTKFRGEFENRLKGVIKDIQDSDGKVILFIDEVHSIVGAGASDGAMDASNILKPALARGEISLIGATTIDEYRKYIEKDPALSRRFQSILIDEPSIKESLEILKGLRDKYEIFHGVKITDEALKSSVELSSRYITDRFLPDKAIDLIDEAASKAKISLDIKPKDLEESEREILHWEIEKNFLEKSNSDKKKVKSLEKKIANGKEKINDIKTRWEKEKSVAEKIKTLQSNLSDLKKEALILRANKNIDELLDLEYIQIKALENSLEKEEKKLKKLQGRRRFIFQEVDSQEIEKVVSLWTGIPMAKMTENDLTKISEIDVKLKKSLIGQDEVVDKVTKAIKRSSVGISDPNRPIASFLFLGPTGVGKTELTKQISKYLFNSDKALIKVDMSELMESHSVSKLIGSPPGYVGYEEGGSLTDKVKRNPYSVILFDEIEKASSDVLNILLQILDEGRVTDSKGQVINFKNTLIILTSNIGSSGIFVSGDKIGFSEKEVKKDLEKEKTENIKKSVKNYLSPEFLNRLDEIVVFKSLKKEDILKIMNLEISLIEKRLLKNNISLKIEEKVLEKIIDDSYNFDFGARPLKRLLEDKILNNLSEEILKTGKTQGEFEISLKKDKLDFKFSPIKKNRKKILATA